MIRHIVMAFALVASGSAAVAQTEVRLALDGPLSAAHAGIAMAEVEGLFAGAGLSVELVATSGSRDAVSRVAVGSYHAAIADLGTLTEFLNDVPGARVIGVMVIEDRPGHAVIARRDAGIAAPADLAGHTLGRVRDDEAARRLPNFASALGLRPVSDGFKSFPDTDALAAALADGTVNAIVARAPMVLPELAAAGLGADDLVVFRMADAPLHVSGRTLAVNTDNAAPGARTAQALIRAIVLGWGRAIADPDAAVAALVALDPTLDPALEAVRLEMIVQQNILTDWVRENGIGKPFNGRLEAGYSELQEDPAFVIGVDGNMVLNFGSLPSQAVRMIAPAP